MNREQFEEAYIDLCFAKALERNEHEKRNLQKWVADEWMGHKYNDVDIQIAWLEWQLERKV